MNKTDLPLYPVLIAVFPVLALYAHNVDQTPIASLLWPLIFSLLVPPVLLVALNLAIRNMRKSGLLIGLLLTLFFGYGHLHGFILAWVERVYTTKPIFERLNLMANLDVQLHWPMMIICLIVLVLGALLIYRTKAKLVSTTRNLNVVAAVLVVLPAVNIVFYALTAERLEAAPEATTTQNAKPPQIKRDIYYIILDGYARQDVLRVFYGFDNRFFLEPLQRQGFYVAAGSHSNFAWTFLSLASSLNYQYINDLANQLGERSQDLRIPYEMIRNNRVSRFLRSQGYEIVHFKSTWGATLRNPYADREIGYERGLVADEYQRVLLGTTMLKLFKSLIVEDLAQLHLHTFAKLAEIPKLRQPTFTFCHMVMPHHPYIFDSDGNVKSEATMRDQFQKGGWDDKQAYVEQLAFVSKKIGEVVEIILQQSVVAPIIVIQSDHGPQVPNVPRVHHVQARMAILNALYLPEGGSKHCYPSMTPVNTFRLILNHYFGTNLPLLEDRCFLSSFSRPFKFSRLTFLESEMKTEDRRPKTEDLGALTNPPPLWGGVRGGAPMKVDVQGLRELRRAQKPPSQPPPKGGGVY